MSIPPEVRAALLGLLNSGLMTTGIFFQKMNGVRGGSIYFSAWLALALVAFAPTFWVGNLALKTGKVAPFLAASSTYYVWSTILGRVVFGEPLDTRIAGGLLLIVAGVALVVSGTAAATARPG